MTIIVILTKRKKKNMLKTCPGKKYSQHSTFIKKKKIYATNQFKMQSYLPLCLLAINKW